MRKKFFAMYALVGALVASPVFTSCIDGEESASVTAVRNERAAQIKAKVAMEQAEAERKAKLEELKLAADMADYEQKKASYEKSLLDYQLQIEQAKDALKAYQETTLSELTTAYTTALSNAANTEWNVVKYNQQITQLKAGYLEAQTVMAEQLAGYQKAIENAKTTIAALKKVQEDGMDKEALEAEIAELKAVKDKAEQTLKEVKVQYGIELTTTNVVFNTHAKNLATVKAAAYTHISSAVKQNTNTGLMYLSEAGLATARTTFETTVGNVEGAEKNLAAAIAELGTEADKKDATYYDATLATPANVQTLYAKLAEAKETFAAAEKVYNEKNDAVEKAKKAVADAKTALDTESAKETPDAAKVTELTTALTTAQTALATAQTALTPAIVTDYNTAKSDLATAEGNVLTAKDGIVVLEATLANTKKNVEEFEAAVAAFAGEDYEAYKEAYAAYTAANDAYTTANTEYLALNSLNTNNLIDDIAEDIAEQEGIIAENETLIRNLAAVIEFEAEGKYWDHNLQKYIYNTEIDSEEMLAAAIAHLEKKIAVEEAKLVLYNKQAEEAKAALDAYLAE